MHLVHKYCSECGQEKPINQFIIYIVPIDGDEYTEESRVCFECRAQPPKYITCIDCDTLKPKTDYEEGKQVCKPCSLMRKVIDILETNWR